MSITSDILVNWIGVREALTAKRAVIYNRLAKLKVRKEYTTEKAVKALNPLVRQAVKHYLEAKMLTRPQSAARAFPMPCRACAAKDLEKAFRVRFKAGQWSALQAAQRMKEKLARKPKSKTKRGARQW